MEGVYSSETPADFQRTRRFYAPEESKHREEDYLEYEWKKRKNNPVSASSVHEQSCSQTVIYKRRLLSRRVLQFHYSTCFILRKPRRKWPLLIFRSERECEPSTCCLPSSVVWHPTLGLITGCHLFSWTLRSALCF
jgi:hypothetical protein